MIISKISEKNNSILKQLLSLYRDDPQEISSRTREYLDEIVELASELLCLSVAVTLNKSAAVSTEKEKRRLQELSQLEGLSILTNEAFFHKKEENESESNLLNAAISRWIVTEHYTKRIRNEMSQAGISVIPFLPGDIYSMYPKKWYRDPEPRTFLVPDDRIPEIREILDRMEFTESKNSPIETFSYKLVKYRGKGGSEFLFAEGIPFDMYGKCHEFIKDVCGKSVREKREMSLAEYAVIMVAKLKRDHIATSSTQLKDLCDLLLLMHTYPDITEGDYFIEQLKYLELEETWDIVKSISEKIEREDRDSIKNFSTDEKQFLKDIISRPFHRHSIIRRYISQRPSGEKFLQPKRYIVSEDRNIVYVMNCKVACSSINASFLQESIEDDVSAHHAVSVSGLHYKSLNEKQKGYYFFSFVRNPYSRLVSCYRNKYYGDVKKYGFKKVYKVYMDGYLGDDEGFTTFVHKVCTLPYSLMEEHFRPQYDNLTDNKGNYICDYIGKFESLEEEFEPIRQKYGLKPLAHYNSSGTVNWMDFYTRETADLVYQTFRRDFDEFGYGESYVELLNYIDSKET